MSKSFLCCCFGFYLVFFVVVVVFACLLLLFVWGSGSLYIFNVFSFRNTYSHRGDTKPTDYCQEFTCAIPLLSLVKLKILNLLSSEEQFKLLQGDADCILLL